MTIRNKGLFHALIGAVILNLILGCSSKQSNVADNFGQKQTKVTADNIPYFVDHLSLTMNSFFADSIYSKAREIIMTHLLQGSNGTITFDCKNDGTITSHPNINDQGIGSLNLTLEACKLTAPTLGEIGISPERLSGRLSGSVLLRVSGFDIEHRNGTLSEDSSGKITNAILTFNTLAVAKEARTATLSGSVTREEPTDEEKENWLPGNYEGIYNWLPYIDAYQVTGSNHQFSRNFKLDNTRILSGAYYYFYHRNLISGIVSDASEGSLALISEKTTQLIHGDDGSMMGVTPILELAGINNSRAEFSDIYADDTVTIKIDENGNGELASEVTLPW